MKIALVVNSFPKASETFIYNHAKGLMEMGHSVRVITHAPSSDDALFCPLKELRIFPVPSLKSNPIKALLFLATHCLSFLKYCQKSSFQPYNISKKLKSAYNILPFVAAEFDIIHFEFSGLAVLYQDILPHIPGKKVVSCRGSAERILPLADPGRLQALKALDAQIDLFHCVTKDMAATMNGYGIPSEHLFVNYPSIDTKRFCKSVRPEKSTGLNDLVRILSVGRINWVKGYPDAFLAIRQLIDHGYAVHYTIIGQNDTPAQIAFMIHTLVLQDHVQLAGALDSDQIITALSEADIFLLPSLSEGLSNAALEAMAMELPVVSTKAGGMNEAILHGENGLLTDLFKPDQISQQIGFLIDHPSERARLGQNARQTVIEKFDLKRQIGVFQKAYENLLSPSLQEK